MSDPAPAAPSGVLVGRLVRITLLGALVGLPVGLLAFGFFWLVHELAHLLWPTCPRHWGSRARPCTC